MNGTGRLPRVGAGVPLETRDTPACSRGIRNGTPAKHERDTERDSRERDTPRARSGTTKRATREIRTWLDSGEPNTWRLVAECADESTSMILLGDLWAGTPMTDGASLGGDLGTALVLEHLARCEACRGWAGPWQGLHDPSPRPHRYPRFERCR